MHLNLHLNLDDASDKIVRFPEPHSVTVKDTVKSIVVGLGLKCNRYSMSRGDIDVNIASTIRERLP